MKFTHIYKGLACGLLMAFTATSCDLDYNPIADYSDVTEGVIENDGEKKEAIFSSKADVEGAMTSIYNLMKDRQEHWYVDKLLIAEAHSDNAYAGTTGAEVVPFETNSLEGSNSVLARDWERFLADIATANRMIIGCDELASLSDTDRGYYQSQAKIFRALIMFDMARMWGGFPVITTIGEDITADNIDTVYPQYFPTRNTIEEAYAQIEKDLTEALNNANTPVNNPDNKTLFTKSVARALLAKVYAEKPLRDYDKVIQYADELAADGFDLVKDFNDLFGVSGTVEEGNIDCKKRNTVESILEAQFTKGAGNWCTWMFGRQLDSWDSSFSWAKWVTPSRDLINAFQAAGDEKRFNESVVYYSCGWSNYYPADNYAFMYKCRSGLSSIIYMRYADILLLKAEALIMTGDLNGAADIIDRIRERAGLGKLDASERGSKDALLDAYLNERRLELAFEGQRWYDLCRLDKVEEVMNAVYAKDSGRLKQVNLYNENSYLLPVPQGALDQNENLTQNPGY